MTKTKQDLAVRVLIELKITNATEAPEHEDSELVKSFYESKLEELIDDGKAYWPLNEIPVAVFSALSKVIAEECKGSFGVEYAKGAEGLSALYSHSSKQSDGQSTVIEYF